MDMWGDMSYLCSRPISERLQLARSLKTDAVDKVILEKCPARSPVPHPEVIAEAIVDAIFSSNRFGKAVAQTHAILSCACLRFNKYRAVLDIVRRKAIERNQILSNALYPLGVQDCIQQLKTLQVEHDKFEKEMLDAIQSIEAQYQDDESQLEAKQLINAIKDTYQQNVEPLFARRSEIVSGDEGIPKFWYETMMNSAIGMDELITVQDAKALEYLTNIKCTRGDADSLKLEFIFENNPYFKDKVLTKILRGGAGSRMSTPIQWEGHKCLTHVDVKKRKSGVCEKCNPFETQEIKKLSFFNFFRTSSDPIDEARDECIGDLFEKTIIPRAVDVFLDRSHYQAIIESLEGARRA